MKSLALLALAALTVLPLAAHDAWHEPRRVVFEAPRCTSYPRWEAHYRHDRWDCRREYRGWNLCPDRDDRNDHLLLRPRPLGPPFGGRMDFR